MFNIFNSESLWVGTDMEMFNKIRTRLEQEGIPYKYKTKNHLSQTMFPAEGTLRSRMGSLGNDVNQMIEYEILVHKKDYEKAKMLYDELKEMVSPGSNESKILKLDMEMIEADDKA